MFNNGIVGYFRRFKNGAVALVRDESGQTTTEYVLLAAVMAVVVLRMKDIMQQQLTRLIQSAFTKAEQDIQSE